MSDARAEPRRNMLDRYELIAEIARGGMGTVYLARLEGVAGFQRLFAIKLMHPHLAADGQFVAMLLDEARIAARIHHPNAVEIIDVCESPRGYYLVMPYVEGFTLERIIEHPTMTPEQRVRFGLRVFRDAAVGLHAAHDIRGDDGEPLGLVHRDVSPQNILVGIDGVGRIADFGVARAAARITASRPGTIKGKPCYMAPEQARGQALDRRADVFALGTVLWEVLTGEQLFYSEAGDAAMLVRVISDAIPAPSTKNPDVPEALDQVCLKALDRDLDARYQTARELAEALEEAAIGARLMASNHKVADGLRDLFGDDIEARRKSIQDHLSGLARPSLPIVGSDVFDVPRLGHEKSAAEQPTRQSKPTPGGAWHESSGERDVARAPTKTAALPAAETAGTASPPAETSSKPASPLRLAVILGAVGLVLIAIAWTILGSSDAEPVAEEQAPGEAAIETTVQATGDVAPDEREPAVEPEPTAQVESEAAPPAGETTPSGPVEAVTGTVNGVTRTAGGILGGRPRGPEKRTTTMRRTPVLEENPYLR